jgi:hypothetical protein
MLRRVLLARWDSPTCGGGSGLMAGKTQDIVLDVCTVNECYGRLGMADNDCEKLLRSARSLLDRFMFEGDEMRDDVANLCMKIDDALPSADVSPSTVRLTETETLNAAA